TGNSRINILNPTAAAANVTISLYNEDGSQAGTTKTLTIGARKLAQIGSADGGFGTPGSTFEDLALVTSNVPVVAMVYTPYTTSTGGLGVSSYGCAVLQTASGPGSFTKNSPANGANVTSLAPTLTWGPGSGAINFEYCVSTVQGSCTGNWILTSKTSAPLSGLSANTTYYWQVRAINGAGTTTANGGTWWSFKTLPPAPSAFGKLTPNSGATGLATNASLTWQASTNATYYTVCWDQTNDGGCGTSWVNVGNVTSYSPGNLLAGKTYSWQVRAYNAAGSVAANSGTWWNFKTVSSGGPPAAFGKQSPTSGATDQPTNEVLNWQASTGATYYTVCVDQTNDGACNATWVNVGNVTSYSPSSLLWGKTYYWQVRAYNAAGSIAANGGTWWSFKTTTWVGRPAAFGKLTPSSGTTGLPTSVTLTWQASTGVTYYSLCRDQTNDGGCSTTWVKIGNVTSYTLTGLAAGQTYYWQVRANNAAGWVPANAGTWWNFKTQ
ncbi:MAG: fibronectin type III domain-containing protein, partial [Rudaea sp.]